MKLAVNYSPQAAELLRAGAVNVDLFKCPDWDGLIEEAGSVAPVYVHFPLVTGELQDADLARVETLLDKTDTPHVNVHLKATPKNFPDMKLDTRAPHDVQQVTDWLIKEVARLTGHFGKRVIAENLIYRGHTLNTLRPAALPEVVSAVVAETGCGMLLDLSHARIAAHYLAVESSGVALWDYLEALPLHRLAELHLTGILFFEERVRDHFGFTGSDWKVMARAFEHIRTGRWATPETVAFEYGGVGAPFEWRSEKAVLKKDLTGLRKLLDSAEN